VIRKYSEFHTMLDKNSFKEKHTCDLCF